MATREQVREMMKTFAQFQHECPLINNVNDLIDTLEKLGTYERVLHRINENACNGYRNAFAQQVDEDKTRKVTKKVQDIADMFGFKVRFNHDPRGGAIRFVLPSGASNGWDHETWGIYW
jgi:hypothetical protein